MHTSSVDVVFKRIVRTIIIVIIVIIIIIIIIIITIIIDWILRINTSKICKINKWIN